MDIFEYYLDVFAILMFMVLLVIVIHAIMFVILSFTQLECNVIS